MAQWYYAHDQKQSGPVSWEKLRELASSGVLEKSDMVWRDGMAQWQKATTVEGLFAKTAVSAGVSAGMPVGAGASGVSRRSDSAGRLSGERALAERTDRSSPDRPTVERRRDLDRDRDDVDDDSPSSPRRKKKKKKDEGMSPGAMAGLIGGCIAGGLVVVIIIIVLLVRTGSRRAANQPPPLPVNAPNAANVAGAGAVQPNSYEVTLGEGQQNLRSFQFQQGQRVTINVNTRGGFIERPDVDLYVSRAGDAAFNAVDISLSEHCFVSFIAPATDQYTLRLENLGPGGATSTVTIR